MRFFKSRQSCWLDPQLSVGKLHGKIPKTNLQYWEAVGPVAEAYNRLKPLLLEVLNQNQTPLPNSDLIYFQIYMVGQTNETSVPHVMFASESKKQRNSAKNIVRKSSILESAEFSGIRAGQWDAPPHIGKQQHWMETVDPYDSSNACEDNDAPKYEANRSSIGRHIHTEPPLSQKHGPHNYSRLHGSSVLDRDVGSIVLPDAMGASPSSLKFVTLGRPAVLQHNNLIISDVKIGESCNRLIIQVDELVRVVSMGIKLKAFGSTFHLLPAHMLLPLNINQDNVDKTCEGHGADDFSFDGFVEELDEDYEQDYEITSRASQSPPDSPQPRFGIPRVRTGSNMLIQREEGEKALIPESYVFTFDEFKLVSWDLDYSIIESHDIEIRFPYSTKATTTKGKDIASIPGFGSSGEHIPEIDVMDCEDTCRLDPTGVTQVKVRTFHGTIIGELQSSTVSIKLPRGKSFVEVYTIDINGFLEPGDCGAAVVDAESNSPYGYIVTGSESSSAAFVMPVCSIIKDLWKRIVVPEPTKSAASTGAPYPASPALTATKNSNGGFDDSADDYIKSSHPIYLKMPSAKIGEGQYAGQANEGTILDSIETAIARRIQSHPKTTLREMHTRVSSFPVVLNEEREVCMFYVSDCMKYYSTVDDGSPSGQSAAAGIFYTESTPQVLSSSNSRMSALSSMSGGLPSISSRTSAPSSIDGELPSIPTLRDLVS